MNKKIILLESGAGNRLANQLWNFASIYAFCLEKKYKCRNHSFFEEKKLPNNVYSLHDYSKYFKNSFHCKLIKVLIFFHLNKYLYKNLKPYCLYVKIIKKIFPKKIIKIDYEINHEKPIYLPPDTALDSEQEKIIKKIENSNCKKFYFSGWLFRSSIGLKKYHREIIQYLQPNKEIAEKINNYIKPLRKKFKKIIGIHIRQSDYRSYVSGKYYFSPQEVRTILDNYINHTRQNTKDLLFILCSDEKLDIKLFSGLNIKMGPGDMTEDLFTLSRTDLIIGSNSTFGAFAAYYGNIPIIVFKRGKIDWPKINFSKKEFNYNNDCTTVHL